MIIVNHREVQEKWCYITRLYGNNWDVVYKMRWDFDGASLMSSCMVLSALWTWQETENRARRPGTPYHGSEFFSPVYN